MPDDDIASNVSDLQGILDDVLDKITKWNKHVPSMQHTREDCMDSEFDS